MTHEKTHANITNSLRCNFCFRKFHSIESLEYHFQHHLRTTRIYSGKTFSDAHGMNGRLLCDLCDRSLGKSLLLIAHIKGHLETTPYLCKICDLKYTDAVSYEQHMLDHSEKDLFQCKECGDFFETYKLLHSHRRNAQRRASNQFEKLRPCRTCGKLYTKRTMRDHIKIHCKSAKVPNVCHFCGKKIKTKPNFFSHLRIHEGLSRLKCKLCKNHFFSEEALNAHEIRRHSKKPQPYKCSYCESRFSKPGIRMRHEMVFHTQERPPKKDTTHKCKECGKIFYGRSSKLRCHYDAVHLKHKKFECTVCNMKFTQQSSLLRHRQIHNDDKRHECSICHHKFLQKYALTRHMLVHTGDKPHHCDQCAQSFRQIFGLTKHIRKYHSKTGSKCKDTKK